MTGLYPPQFDNAAASHLFLDLRDLGSSVYPGIILTYCHEKVIEDILLIQLVVPPYIP